MFLRMFLRIFHRMFLKKMFLRSTRFFCSSNKKYNMIVFKVFLTYSLFLKIFLMIFLMKIFLMFLIIVSYKNRLRVFETKLSRIGNARGDKCAFSLLKTEIRCHGCCIPQSSCLETSLSSIH